MRLLKKSEVTKQKSLERQREVEEGMKLARRVDSLRELQANEEESFSKFREKTVKKINDDIAALAEKRNVLSDEVRLLHLKRTDMLRPIDEERSAIAEAQERINNREHFLFKWDESLEKLDNDLSKRERGIERKEQQSAAREEFTSLRLKEIEAEKDILRKSLEEAENKKIQAQETLDNAEIIRREAEELENSQILFFKQKEQEYAEREAALSVKERQVEDQRQTLERAFTRLETDNGTNRVRTTKKG